MLERETIEKTGASFEEGRILAARTRTWEALELVASRIRSGMTEEEGLAIANATIAELGAAKRWHRSYVRFGPNTLQPYGFDSKPGVILGENDIFFIDLGPVWDGYEGDCGKTFTVGDDAEMQRCAADAQALHKIVRDHWAHGQVTGKALYDFAIRAAAEKGWELNLVEANGHRLSDFPHALYYRGGISDVDFVPAAHRWVLEIQIKHPSREFGAFYEDLLN